MQISCTRRGAGWAGLSSVTVTGVPLKKQYFLDILEGFDMDRSGVMVRPTLEQLERYCYCVASCVGLLSVSIFGYKSPNIPNFALHLGHAFQLSNIFSDIK